MVLHCRSQNSQASHPACASKHTTVKQLCCLCRMCSKLYVWDWKEHTLRQSIDLGADGMIPLEIRFAHEPSATWGYVVSGRAVRCQSL